MNTPAAGLHARRNFEQFCDVFASWRKSARGGRPSIELLLGRLQAHRIFQYAMSEQQLQYLAVMIDPKVARSVGEEPSGRVGEEPWWSLGAFAQCGRGAFAKGGGGAFATHGRGAFAEGMGGGRSLLRGWAGGQGGQQGAAMSRLGVCNVP
eukprot:362433-Chlamydomonas_euryale.AAC.2